MSEITKKKHTSADFLFGIVELWIEIVRSEEKDTKYLSWNNIYEFIPTQYGSQVTCSPVAAKVITLFYKQFLNEKDDNEEDEDLVCEKWYEFQARVMSYIKSSQTDLFFTTSMTAYEGEDK